MSLESLLMSSGSATDALIVHGDATVTRSSTLANTPIPEGEESDYRFNYVRFSHNGHYMVVGYSPSGNSGKPLIKVWDIRDYENIKLISGRLFPINTKFYILADVAVSNDGRYAASRTRYNDHGEIVVYDLQSGEIVFQHYRTAGTTVYGQSDVHFTPDSRYFIYSASGTYEGSSNGEGSSGTYRFDLTTKEVESLYSSVSNLYMHSVTGVLLYNTNDRVVYIDPYFDPDGSKYRHVNIPNPANTNFYGNDPVQTVFYGDELYTMFNPYVAGEYRTFFAKWSGDYTEDLLPAPLLDPLRGKFSVISQVSDDLGVHIYFRSFLNDGEDAAVILGNVHYPDPPFEYLPTSSIDKGNIKAVSPNLYQSMGIER